MILNLSASCAFPWFLSSILSLDSMYTRWLDKVEENWKNHLDSSSRLTTIKIFASSWRALYNGRRQRKTFLCHFLSDFPSSPPIHRNDDQRQVVYRKTFWLELFCRSLLCSFFFYFPPSRTNFLFFSFASWWCSSSSDFFLFLMCFRTRGECEWFVFPIFFSVHRFLRYDKFNFVICFSCKSSIFMLL